MKRKTIISLVLICLICVGNVSCAGGEGKGEAVSKDFPLSNISSNKLIVKNIEDIFSSYDEHPEKFPYINDTFNFWEYDFFFPDWSPDGKEIVFWVHEKKGRGNANFWKMSVDTSSMQQLSNYKSNNRYRYMFSGKLDWSPDGKKIVFEASIIFEDDDKEVMTDIYVMNVDGSNLVKLTNTGDNHSPSWSPDGDKIVFVSYRMDKGNGIWIMNSDGSNQVQLTIDVGISHNPSYSPDGTKIVFDAWKNKNTDVYIIDVDETNLKQLTTDTGTDECPKWSPDGTKILFSAERSGGDNLWIMNTDGSEQTHLPTKIEYTGNCGWSPDGTKIVFEGNDQNKGNPSPLYIMTLGVQE